MLPKQAVKSYGKKILVLGIVLLTASIAAYWYPLVSIVIGAVALLCHEGLAFLQKVREDGMPFYFSRKNKGLMILGVIPDSPASKMELKVGELITKVNGNLIGDEKDFYEALQKNRAHCRLEVFDTNGEVRFEQRALYEGDHYELGILFVQDERNEEERIG
jgi:S1-C subfamily serine protease